MELASAIDFSHYSHFPDEYSNECMEMASCSDDEDLNSEEHELDLQEQLLRGADYEDMLEDEEMDEDYAMDDAYWQSDCSSTTSIRKMTAPLMESSSDEDDSILDQSLSGPVNNGSHYDEEDEDSEEGAKVKGVGVGKGGAYLLASSTEMLRIRFPFQSLSLRLSDFLCLQEGDYLNDTIIDFYLNHIVEHLLPDEPDRRVTVLPSVFWHNLSMRQNSLPDDVESMTEREKDHARFEDILEFVTDFELVDVDYVVIPVNEWEHWSLIMVCHPFTSHSRIICFDSQLASDPNDLRSAAQLIADFFKYTHTSRGGASVCPSMETSLVVPFVPSNLQQQENHYDCGLYVLEYARRFLLNPPKKMESFDFVAEYPDFSVDQKRCEIQRVILSLCANRALWEKLIQMLEVPPAHLIDRF
ncbi:ulp-4 [Pristionchus pacificus]|uniref:Ulp-4 n=1 Tax=Pristionchus pacificus TaxID=54126 RepID=A0A2A6B9C9_PRIPA|nr:ulp-4 [Pristionchus pacificus]|eukprot:PDM62485.1 ulp-4 [Pristionchus pacificus]